MSFHRNIQLLGRGDDHSDRDSNGTRGSNSHARHRNRAVQRSKWVRWHDPAILGTAAAEMSGLEFMQALADGRLPPPPMAELIGARLDSVGEGESLFLYSPHESAYDPLGGVHGGVICTLLDFAASAAVHTELPVGVGFSTIEIKVSFLQPIRADTDEVAVHGETLRVGRRVAFAQAEARSQDGKLVGQATSSIAVQR